MGIVSLFDHSGNALFPWAEAGHDCYAFDLLNEDNTVRFPSGGKIRFVKLDINHLRLPVLKEIDTKFLMGWPPCTDLAVSGAAHFQKKALADPLFQEKAFQLAKFIPCFGNALGIPWFFENPVSVLSTLYRKPNYTFHPYEYGGYLPEDDVHPLFPKYIAPRDAYPKKTCIWSNDKFIMPEKKPVSVPAGDSAQHRLLGGKSAFTKRVRSEGPRGFLRAVYLANKDHVNDLHLSVRREASG